MRWILIVGWTAGVGFGCGGSESAKDAVDSFCGLTDLFHGACGGQISGSGTSPLGAPFDPTAVYVAVGSTCSPSGTDHYLESVEIAYGPAHDFAHITFTDQADGGAGAFLGSHAVTATFDSYSTCMQGPMGLSVTITSLAVDASVDVTAGDDPNAIWTAHAGTVSATLTFSGATGSGSASFTSPYCQFSACP